MKAIVWMLLALVSVVAARAGNAIPDEIVGTWKTQNDGKFGFMLLRSDGLTLVGGASTSTALASFEPKDSTLTLTYRDQSDHVFSQILFHYDPKAGTLAGIKGLHYYDRENEKVKLPQPLEQPYPYTFEHINSQIDEGFRSLDLEKTLKHQP